MDRDTAAPLPVIRSNANGSRSSMPRPWCSA